jgi:hypothetical protein
VRNEELQQVLAKYNIKEESTFFQQFLCYFVHASNSSATNIHYFFGKYQVIG